jgi:Ca2+-binding EF-hand superfamily protein
MVLKNKLGIGAFIVAGTAITVGGFVGSMKILDDIIHRDEERAITYQLLDKDRNGKIDSEEMKVFFDTIGKNPYPCSLNSMSRDDLRTFLNFYDGK